jgi:hypothetical protein
MTRRRRFEDLRHLDDQGRLCWMLQSEMHGGEVTVSRRLVREGSTNSPNIWEAQGLSPGWLLGLVKSGVAAICSANEVPPATLGS